MKKEKIWFIFDSRYLTDPDSAICFEVCGSLKEAKESAEDYGDAVIVQGSDVGGVITYDKIVKTP